MTAVAPLPPKRVASHAPRLTDLPPHLQRFPKVTTSHHRQPMPAAWLELLPPITTSTPDHDKEPGHDRAEETPQQPPVAPFPPKRSAYVLCLRSSTKSAVVRVGDQVFFHKAPRAQEARTDACCKHVRESSGTHPV